MGLIENVKRKVEIYKNELQGGYALLKKTQLEGEEDTLVFLRKLFEEEETRISAEHNKPYITDDYENGVRQFASSLILLLVEMHDELKQNRVYKELLRQRHLAYAFFHGLKDEQISRKDILDDREYGSLLYNGLVDFYYNFYGRFADNEEAILLLCNYYPKAGIEKTEEQLLSWVLYHHMSNAGTPDDIGYAYHGIEMIQDYIGNLPGIVVIGILRQYWLYNILNQKVSRHQIFTIIQYAHFSEEEKHKLKFWFLDSLLLADCFNNSFYKKAKTDGENVIMHVEQYTLNLEGEQIGVFQQPEGYWGNTNYRSGQRTFFLDKNPVFQLRLENGKVKICNKKSGNWVIREELDYHENEWLLDTYQNKEMGQTILNAYESGSGDDFTYNHMTFSLLYLNNYRRMHKQVIDFEHRFQCIDGINIKKKDMREDEDIPYFYGKNVHSLSCIVGKNGTGKTSVIDFLRESFFKLLKILKDFDVDCENGYVDESKYADYNILDPGTQFAVVFCLGGEDFYLTNIPGMKVTDVLPFQRETYRSVHEYSKVVYFSNMIRSDEDLFFAEEGNRIFADSSNREKERYEVKRALNNFRQIDYSDAVSLKRRIFSIESAGQNDEFQTVNKDFCYQFTFLRNVAFEKICELLDMQEDKKLLIRGTRSGKRIEKEVPLKAFSQNFEELDQTEEDYMKLPDAKITPFSSGQYSKFSFLAKLYWFLEGYERRIKQYRAWGAENVFSEEEVLSDDETALIFIDEGEVYYHPEWQRRYMKTLLDMVNQREREYRKTLQIVITTNSPFILSDIRKEDVQYLSAGQAFDSTFGQNIHKLLKENFFMDYTIGEYSREIIETIMIQVLPDGQNKDKIESGRERITKAEDFFEEGAAVYDALKRLICQIGEPVYRGKLMRMLEASKKFETGKQIAKLEETKRILEEKRIAVEEEIKRLERRGKL